MVAFHQIAFTFRFDTLPATKEQRKNFLNYAPINQIKDAEPFVIEVPAPHRNVVNYNNVFFFFFLQNIIKLILGIA